MEYQNIKSAIFESRPNRFVAKVYVDGVLETVHVKNTGRCKELLLPGVKVILEESSNPNRKTKYDLIAVYKEKFGLINMDSQAPNAVVNEWLLKQNYSLIKPEYTYGNSRIDFYMEKYIENPEVNEDDSKQIERFLLEVKGCTLEKNGIGYFPDAPTTRGVKHLHELTKAVKDGFHTMVAFVIQMENVYEVRPNIDMHMEFGKALVEAQKAGVEILFLYCKVEENRLEIIGEKKAEQMDIFQ